MRGRTRVLLASQPLDFGVPAHVLSLVEGLDSDRYELEVACPRDSVLWRSLECRAEVALHELAAARRPSPVDVVSWLRLSRLVRRADVVHGHSAKAGFLTRLAAVSAGRTRRCIFTPHAWSFWAVRGAERRLYRGLERQAARWCRFIIAVSKDERNFGLAAGIGRPDQYRVIPNGIDVERYAAPPQPVPGRIVMIGRLDRQKRVDVALRALALVRTRRPGAHLQIVGEGPQAEGARALAAELGIADAVTFLGRRDDVPELLSTAACLVLSSDYEGMSLTVLEAMAAAVPVVATQVGGVDEAVVHGETGFVVPRRRPDALADTLDRVLGDPARAAALGAAGRVRAAELFSKERMIRETGTLYEELLRDE
jgi:glycosyltransferase involved in cell wall biosynthesis